MLINCACPFKRKTFLKPIKSLQTHMTREETLLHAKDKVYTSVVNPYPRQFPSIIKVIIQIDVNLNWPDLTFH